MNEKARGVVPLLLVLLINTLGYGVLWYRGVDDPTKLLYYACGIGGMILFSFILIKLLNMGDAYLFLIVSMLLSVGLIMLFRLNWDYGERQFRWFLISVAGFFLTYFIYRGLKIWHKIPAFYIFASVGLFLATLVFGTSIKGAKNWIVLGGFRFQPSELIKIMYIFTIAYFFSVEYKNSEDLQGYGFMPHLFHSRNGRQLFLMAITYMNLGFLVLQREWGLAVLFFLIYFCLLYVYGCNFKFLLLNLLLASAGGFGGYKFMHHIQVRVATWQNPFQDPTGSGYQIAQSLFAIGSGGFAGSGLGSGYPQFIPEVHSDFIFSAICEEMGILGGMAVIMLYFMFVYRGFKISLSVTNSFNKVVALGITIMYGFQTFIIIGGVVKFIPLTGITLPFISYGGSSLLTSFIALGILQAISSKKEELSDDIQ